jgi:glycosyltransferase involved in cell wall biosynthesis
MGGLSILKDCLAELVQRSDKYLIVALVHKKELVGVSGIHYYEFPRSKRSILDRLYHEYWLFWKLSRRLKPLLWLSLHNTTPNVNASKRAVYCQNSASLYDFTWRDIFLQPRAALVRTFLDFMYRINIRRNDAVIVQTDWVRQQFCRRFDLDHVVVAHPVISDIMVPAPRRPSLRPFVFFYPSYPSIYKNFEVICDAVKLLRESSITDFNVWLTFSASDNRYARQISERCAGLTQIHLLGRLSREEVFRRYADTDCLLFPSKLETWGLPISEFGPYDRPIIVADAPYAREAVGNHPCTAFFPVNSATKLARLMQDVMQGAPSFAPAKAPTIDPPFARSWEELFDILLDAAPAPSTQQHNGLLGNSLAHDVTEAV